jgi:uncharacterized protein YcfL
MRLLLIVLLLTGCSTAVPVARKFPDAPETLMKPCADLKKIDKENPLLSEVVKSVTENYMLYHECALKSESWIEWYNVQKKVFQID